MMKSGDNPNTYSLLFIDWKWRNHIIGGFTKTILISKCSLSQKGIQEERVYSWLTWITNWHTIILFI